MSVERTCAGVDSLEGLAIHGLNELVVDEQTSWLGVLARGGCLEIDGRHDYGCRLDVCTTIWLKYSFTSSVEDCKNNEYVARMGGLLPPPFLHFVGLWIRRDDAERVASLPLPHLSTLLTHTH